MPSENSITDWINATRQGDDVAAAELWKRYFGELMSIARQRMGSMPRETYDEEDAAISTFRVMCTKLREGSYPELSNRDELWHLMLKVLARKVIRRADYESAIKRPSKLGKSRLGNATVLSEAELEFDLADNSTAAAYVAEQCELLFAKLDDPHLEQLVLWRLEGFTNDEIALKMNRTRRTIQRMLVLVRDLWLNEMKA